MKRKDSLGRSWRLHHVLGTYNGFANNIVTRDGYHPASLAVSMRGIRTIKKIDSRSNLSVLAATVRFRGVCDLRRWNCTYALPPLPGQS
jgi:hypothetical protein